MFRPLLTLEIDLQPPVSLGPTQTGELRVIPFEGGTFHGPELNGRVLPGGSDWQEILPDGSLDIHARYLLETDRGERIEIRSDGVRSGSPEVLAQLTAGTLLPASAYYFRTAIRLRTGAERLSRLNGILAFSIGERRPKSVHLTVHELL